MNPLLTVLLLAGASASDDGLRVEIPPDPEPPIPPEPHLTIGGHVEMRATPASGRKHRRCPACGRTGPLGWKLCDSDDHPKRPVKTRQERR